MIEIWESKIKKENDDRLPIIIPLLIYHDQREWNINTSLGQMIPGYNELPGDIKKYLPNFEYVVYDLTKYKDEDVKLESITRIIIKILKDVKYAERTKIIEIFSEGMRLLRDVVEKDTVTHYLESCLRYILSVRNDMDKDEMIKIAGAISVEGSELVMTAAERLIEEGMEKGMEKGIEEGIKKVAKNAIIKGMKVEDIIELTGLSEKDVEKIRKEMLQ